MFGRVARVARVETVRWVVAKTRVAFVSHEVKVNAQKAVYGRGYNNFIPSVQWSRKSIVILPLNLDVLTDPLLEPQAGGR